MKRDRHSRTAIIVAVVRALHTEFERPVIFNDPFAGQLAGPVWRAISSLRVCYWIGTKIIYRGMDSIRRQIIARARYAEDKLEKATDSGIRQYVIIGAGFDSFALRRKDLVDKLSVFVFELDHPASQRLKRNRIKQLSLALPDRHEFIGINFENEGLNEALARSSYSAEYPAFFSWLGTVHYLTPPAVEKTLTAIAAIAHPGSELVVDYAADEALSAAGDQKMVKKLKRFTDRRGEPILSTFHPDQFQKLVSEIGFTIAESFSPKDQAQRYFKLPDGRVQSMPGSYFAHLRLS